MLAIELIMLWALCWFGMSEKDDQKCQNGGKWNKQIELCECDSKFIGEHCEYPGIKLTDSQQNITIGKEYTYLYLEPEDLNFYRIEFTFCMVKPMPGYTNQVYLELQGLNNQFTPGNEQKQKLNNFTINQNECHSLGLRYLWYRRKTNQKLQKIIMGIRIHRGQQGERLLQEGEEVPLEVLSIKCNTEELFSINFVIMVVIIFFSVLGLLLLSSLLYFLLLRFVRRRRNNREKKKKIKLVKKIMPAKKYYDLTEQIHEEQLCSICLMPFQKKDLLRRTPCGHSFHQKCLDCWCQNNLSCPVCRFEFSQITQLPKKSTNMTRQPML